MSTTIKEYLTDWLDRHRAEQSTLRVGHGFLEGVPDEAWMDDSACSRAIHADAWFPEHGGMSPNTSAALRVCREHCPVQQQCLAYALARPKLEGIWGGTTSAERARIRTARRGA